MIVERDIIKPWQPLPSSRERSMIGFTLSSASLITSVSELMINCFISLFIKLQAAQKKYIYILANNTYIELLGCFSYIPDKV